MISRLFRHKVANPGFRALSQKMKAHFSENTSRFTDLDSVQKQIDSEAPNFYCLLITEDWHPQYSQRLS